MHSLPSRRKLSQPIFFRSKCHRLSPAPFPVPPPPPPPPAPACPVIPRLLPSPSVPNLLPLAPPRAHALTCTLVSGAAQIHSRQADAVGRQGSRTLAQSAYRDSLNRAFIVNRVQFKVKRRQRLANMRDTIKHCPLHCLGCIYTNAFSF